MIESSQSQRLAATPPAVAAYLRAVTAVCGESSGSVLSLVAFGSAATGGYDVDTSDIDLLVVLADGVDSAERDRVRRIVGELEAQHDLVKMRPSGRGRVAAALKRFADRTSDNGRSFFVCTRADLLSGEARRILNLAWPQAVFVDRVVVPSIVASAVTVWGEDLLDHVDFQSIGRVDVAKSCFALFAQCIFAAAVYAVFPHVTIYAMDALKRSIHNCYYCHSAQSAPLRLEVAYFERRYGARAAFTQLLALRQRYRPSLRFVIRSLFSVFELHLKTAIDVRFPREARGPTGSTARVLTGDCN